MTPEGKVKKRVKDLLSAHSAYWHMPVQNGMGKPSLDFVGCYRGKFYAIETKAGSGQMTDRQKLTAEEMEKSGAAVFLVNDVEGLDTLERWLKDH